MLLRMFDVVMWPLRVRNVSRYAYYNMMSVGAFALCASGLVKFLCCFWPRWDYVVVVMNDMRAGFVLHKTWHGLFYFFFSALLVSISDLRTKKKKNYFTFLTLYSFTCGAGRINFESSNLGFSISERCGLLGTKLVSR